MITNKCLAIIKAFEGFRSKPYLCSALKPTIGFGTRWYDDDRRVTMDDSPISIDYANYLLEKFVNKVDRLLDNIISIELNQNQRDAIVSFVYNIGIKKFKTSTLLRKLNAGDFEGASNEFTKWVYVDSKKTNGLINRRKAEAKLFKGE